MTTVVLNTLVSRVDIEGLFEMNTPARIDFKAHTAVLKRVACKPQRGIRRLTRAILVHRKECPF